MLEADLEALATRAALREWLEGTRMVSESNTPLFSGADGEYEDLPDDQLSFLTAAVTPLGDRVTAVTLYIDRDPETPETGLVASISAWLAAFDTFAAWRPPRERSHCSVARGLWALDFGLWTLGFGLSPQVSSSISPEP